MMRKFYANRGNLKIRKKSSWLTEKALVNLMNLWKTKLFIKQNDMRN